MTHYYQTKIVLLCLLFGLNSCTQSKEALPEGILSREVLTNAIVDIQLLESAHKSLSIAGNTQMAMKDTSYAIVFNKYNTDAKMFDSTLRAYAELPRLMSEVMEDVAKKINKSK